jgi:hypothetical protein
MDRDRNYYEILQNPSTIRIRLSDQLGMTVPSMKNNILVYKNTGGNK